MTNARQPRKSATGSSDSDRARAGLLALVAEEMAKPAPDWAAAAARSVAARHGEAALGVIFYGSCLRDAAFEDRILDFYLVVDDYARALGSRRAGFFAHLVPPNVYYCETPWNDVVVRAKYAVLTLDDLERLSSAQTFQSYFWARFAQPTRLIRIRDGEVSARVAAAMAEAVITATDEVAPLLDEAPDVDRLWSRASEESYRTEFRSEDPDRVRRLYAPNRPYFARVTPLALAALGRTLPDEKARRRAEQHWRLRRLQGRGLSLLRLVKGAFTFAGGVEYILWKIARHSGVEVKPTPFQRRHPLLAGLMLFWTLKRRGGFR